MNDYGKPRWNFEKIGKMGGATGSAFADTLQGAGIPPEAELAREAIQNSCDAMAKGRQKVRVAFRLVTLEDEDRDVFLVNLCLIDALRDRLASLNLGSENCLAKPNRPLRLMYVEDYETIGLRGDPRSRNSHFRRLLLSLGDSAKAKANEASGGSYGYGKSALSLNSRLRTIVAYSAFEPDETGASARLMGCSYFDSHDYADKEWSGRSWFGILDRDDPEFVSPLIDDDAHEWAKKLGFESRADGHHGTSILIVDSHGNDISILKRGVEDWWWPRLVDQELEVEIHANGSTVYPQPKSRQDLLPFIECYSLALGKSEPVAPHQKCDKFNKHKGMDLGSFALQVLPADRIDDSIDDRLGCFALLRSAKMVVQYSPVGRHSPPVVGVFVAHPDIDNILKLSEPPNHDRWDEDSRRLEIALPDEDTAREVVRSVSKRLKDQMRKFQAQATPPRPREERRLLSLERELGALFKPDQRTATSAPGASVPVEITFRQGPAARVTGASELETFTEFQIRLSKSHDEDECKALVRPRISVLVDEHGNEGSLLPLRIETGSELSEGLFDPEPEILVTLSKTEWSMFSVVSVPYDPLWSTKVSVEVTSPEVS